MYELSKQEFSIINFEALITKIRNNISEVNFILFVFTLKAQNLNIFCIIYLKKESLESYCK